MAAAGVLLAACGRPSATPRPAARTTGVAELDNIIAIALSGNADRLRSVIAFTQTACTRREALGGPPKCQDGEAEGTPVEVLPFLGPEGSFIRRGEIDAWPGIQVSEVYAVYQVSGTAYSEADYPAGEYAIAFLGPDDDNSVTLQVEAGRIVRIDYGFGYPPAIRSGDIVRYVLPPVDSYP